MSLLSDKLKALGVKIGARGLSPPRPRRPYPIEQVVSGRFEETPYGDIFLVETRYPLDHRQGCVPLRITASLQVIAEWAEEPRLAQVGLETFAFLDTETTGLGGGTGTYAFLVGVGRYEANTFYLVQFFMRDPAEEPALLTALTRFLQPCQALVTFNGKGFDVPLLDTRYVATGYAVNSRESPLASLAHLDLLPLARKLWRDRLPSRALGYLEEHILGMLRAQEDVPGWAIPGLYFEYLRDGDARPLKNVLYHNTVDVLSMAALLSHVAGLFDDPTGADVHGLDIVAMGRMLEDLGYVEMAVRLYECGLARDLPHEMYWRTVRRLSFIRKRRDNWSEAVGLWYEAACDGQVYAHVELAKYYEHRRRDYHEALRWTQEAIDRVNASENPRYERDRWMADLERRSDRLQRKLAGRMRRRAGT